MLRTEPNIIITGTPGTGKTSHAEELATKTGLHHLSVNDVVKKHNIGEASDDPDDPNLQIVDEDRLLDCVENDLEEGGQIIDWHACDLFPPSMIDLVCVIRCDNQLLYDRLSARGYKGKKLEENDLVLHRGKMLGSRLLAFLGIRSSFETRFRRHECLRRGRQEKGEILRRRH